MNNRSNIASRLPLVSIVVPSFNQGEFLEKTILSLLAQTYSNTELIIVDGGSDDSSQEILQLYRNKVDHLVIEPDNGQSDAIIKGFNLAKGELVGWVNSDDLLYADCIEQVSEAYMLNQQAVLYYNSRIDIIDRSGRLLGIESVKVNNREQLLRQNVRLIQPGSFYSKSALEKVGYFDSTLRYSMDLDLWLRLLNTGELVDIGCKPFAAYRHWEGTKTSTGSYSLYIERKRMLKSHGAGFFDPTILRIHTELLKLALKEIPGTNRVISDFKHWIRR